MMTESSWTITKTVCIFLIICLGAIFIIFALGLFNSRQTRSQYKCGSDYDCLIYLEDKCFNYSSCAIKNNNDYMMVSRVRNNDIVKLNNWECQRTETNNYNDNKSVLEGLGYSKSEISKISCGNVAEEGNDDFVELPQKEAQIVCNKIARTKDIKYSGRLPTFNELKAARQTEKIKNGYQKNGFHRVSLDELTSNDNDDRIGTFRCIFEGVQTK